MSLVDKIIYKSPEEVVELLTEAYSEKQAFTASILSNPDLKAALVGALLGSGAGGIGGAISAAKYRNKITINDILRGALLGSVPGATAGYLSKSLFDIDPGAEISSGASKLVEKAKNLKKYLSGKKDSTEQSEPPATPPAQPPESSNDDKQRIKDEYKDLPPGNPSRGSLLGQKEPVKAVIPEAKPDKDKDKGWNLKMPPQRKKKTPIDITNPGEERKSSPGLDFIGFPY